MRSRRWEQSLLKTLRKVCRELGSPESNVASIAGLGGAFVGHQLYGRGVKLNTLRPVSWKSPHKDSEFMDLLEAYKKRYPHSTPSIVQDTAAYYAPKTDSIGLRRGERASTLAHELGHATQRKFLMSSLGKALRLGGAGVAGGAGLGVLGTDDSAKAKQYALLSNVGALPLLGLEAHASGKGSQLMREVSQQKGTWDKLKGLSKLKYRMGAWKGLPTYAMAGIGVPWLTYAIKKSLGGYGKPKA